MAIHGSRKRARQATVLGRASDRQAGAARAEGARGPTAPDAANGDANVTARPPSPELQRLLLAHAHRARHLLSRRETVASLSRSGRREMLDEVQRLHKVVKTLQQQIEVTTRSVEGLDRLVFHLQRLTRQFGVSGASPSTLGTARVEAARESASEQSGAEQSMTV